MTLESSILHAFDWCDTWRIQIPRAVQIDAAKAFKTYAFYLRVLNGLVVDLYRGDISEAEFVDSMAELIEQQLRRAFNEGMRQNGLDPIEDMTEEWEQAFQNIVANEFQYVDGFASEVAGKQGSLAEFQARVQLWANRYDDVVNQAVLITASGKDRLVWRLGGTEEHCVTCSALDGVVAFAREWETAGIKPQSPPNPNLDCGGWRCDCSLEPTDQRRSPKALDVLLNIGVRL
jgi:hypothetical protein